MSFLYRTPIALLLLGLAILLPRAGVTSAETWTVGHGRSTVAVKFHLHVSGTVAPNATFWLAYGPVAGRFGVIRLKAQSPGNYVARQSLPAGSHGVFAYIMGLGTMHSREGAGPGNPTLTIRRFSVSRIQPGSIPQVSWTAPVG